MSYPYGELREPIIADEELGIEIVKVLNKSEPVNTATTAPRTRLPSHALVNAIAGDFDRAKECTIATLTSSNC